MSDISLKVAQSALINLEKALAISHPTELERDGTIQRFEYSYEIIWKISQRVLKENGISAETPKDVFRSLGRINWISNVEQWLDFQKSRNSTSHEYGEKLAKLSYQLAKDFLPLATDLFQVLKAKQSE